MGITVQQAIDLITVTLPELGENKVTDLTDTVTKRLAMKRMMKEKNVVIDSGDRIEFSVLTESDNNAQNVKLHQVQNTNITPGASRGYVDWRFTSTSYAFDRRELKINQGKAKILDIVKMRRAQSLIGLSKKCETNFWACPAASDDESPHGLYYWLVRNASKGFNGAAPSGYTEVGGLNPTTLGEKWKNWTDTYSNISRADFVDAICEGITKTDFETEITDIASYNTGNDMAFYSNYNMISGLRHLAEDQNENLGKDVASMFGMAVIHGIPVTYVPGLDADATDPVYGVNHGVFKTYFMEGEVFKEHPPERAPLQPNDVVVRTDLQYNFVCQDRRRNLVMYKV